MTKEEAIKEIEKVFEPAFANYIITALTEGATSSDKDQQSGEDCVSRKAVMDGIDRYIEKAQSTGTKDDLISFEELVVKQLPSVTPSCEEREKGECPYYAG